MDAFRMWWVLVLTHLPIHMTETHTHIHVCTEAKQSPFAQRSSSPHLRVWIDLYYSYGPYTRRQDYSQGAIEICAKGSYTSLLQAKPESSFTVGKHPQVDGTP